MADIHADADEPTAPLSLETRDAIYGLPPQALAAVPATARQVSPSHPGASILEVIDDGELASITLAAPPGTLERRYALAQALRATAPGGRIVALASKQKGGARLRKELESFGCKVMETAKSHHRICACDRPAAPFGLTEAFAEGGPRRLDALDLWSQPGVFSWDRIDPGSALLAARLPPMSGRGVDLGCGIGYLARAVLAASPKVERLSLVDIDRRAIEAARLNVVDRRAEFDWADVTGPGWALDGLDFVVMNPPFHDTGMQDHRLGQTFIRRAAQMLRKGGVCWLVANRHLPYEAELASAFTTVEVRADEGGYKVFEARR